MKKEYRVVTAKVDCIAEIDDSLYSAEEIAIKNGPSIICEVDENGKEIGWHYPSIQDSKIEKQTAEDIIQFIDGMCSDENADVIWHSGAYIRNKYIAQKIREKYKI